ncbi:FHA domain-containing protein [candidate division KSB1 bacterium]|nr:FHA domain-containing protein [candidate division KSB1 bacterium]
MYYLVIEKGEQLHKRFHLKATSNIIGRTSECDIPLPFSHEISRRHARLDIRDQNCYLTDLGSANGTTLNGRRLKPNESYLLKVNDRFEIAEEIALRLVADAEPAAPPITHKPLPESHFSNTSRIFSAKEILEAVEANQAESSAPLEEAVFVVQNKSKLLQILNRVEKELISIRPIDEYLKMVMDLVFEMIPADRGFLMLQNEKSGELEAKQIKLRKEALIDSKQLIRISKTIAEKVMRENVAILTPDAIMDDRFSDGDSIFYLGIRSAMCVPLWNKDNVLGIIYVDNLASADSFSDDDLALLIAFANHAAIGIEQARLNERILRESRIRDHLERYHSPEIVEMIIKKEENAKIEPIECEVTIFFADIVGFTSMIESMQPLEISDLLNEFYSTATNVIFRHDGTLDKFIGDSVMAIFGAPIHLKDGAERALSCALEIQEAVIQLNQGKPMNRQVQLRIGINSGKVVAGDFGSYKRIEYTVLGNTVNVAARIQAELARPGQIIVAEATYELTKDKFRFDYLGEFAIRGKVEKIKAYTVQSELTNQQIY